MAKGKILYKTVSDIEGIRQACILVSKTLALAAKMLKPGVLPEEVDKKAEEFILNQGAKPAFKGYNGFPATLCISLNECVVHGIPNKNPFKEGDIISIDCGVLLNGYFGDAAYTFAIGPIANEAEKLLIRTRDSLYLGIENCVVGKRIGDIGYAIQESTEKRFGYGVVRDLVGHGVGIQLHEPPEVPNYGRRGIGNALTEGMVLAIEPMINLGSHKIKVLKDGWTIVTQDGKASAHFEHTVAIGKEKAMILSDHNIIEEEVKKNDFLVNF